MRWRADDEVASKGTGDDFYKKGQLLPENFEKAAKEAGVGEGIRVRYQEVCASLVIWCGLRSGGSADMTGVCRDMTTVITSSPLLQASMWISPRSICSLGRFRTVRLS